MLDVEVSKGTRVATLESFVEGVITGEKVSVSTDVKPITNRRGIEYLLQSCPACILTAKTDFNPKPLLQDCWVSFAATMAPRFYYCLFQRDAVLLLITRKLAIVARRLFGRIREDRPCRPANRRVQLHKRLPVPLLDFQQRMWSVGVSQVLLHNLLAEVVGALWICGSCKARSL